MKRYATYEVRNLDCGNFIDNILFSPEVCARQKLDIQKLVESLRQNEIELQDNMITEIAELETIRELLVMREQELDEIRGHMIYGYIHTFQNIRFLIPLCV